MKGSQLCCGENIHVPLMLCLKHQSVGAFLSAGFQGLAMILVEVLDSFRLRQGRDTNAKGEKLNLFEKMLLGSPQVTLWDSKEMNNTAISCGYALASVDLYLYSLGWS